MKKLEENEVVTNIERPVHHRFAHSAENRRLELSIRRFQELELS